MRAPELKNIACELVDTGAPGLPTALLAQEVPLFEVEFAALEFAEEAKLPASDWAALALARALGEVSPADLDAFLGLGEAVCEGLVRRLVEEALLEERREEAAPVGQPVEEFGLGAFFRRLFGANAATMEAPVAPQRASTAARKIRDSHAATFPICVLSTAGAQALERGAVAQRRVRPARLLFLADPLLYVGTVDEKRHRHSQHRRPRPLEPEHVPEALRVLDAALGLPPDERVGTCGIESSVRGFSGQLVGIVPGAQWEVRPFVLGHSQRRRDGRQLGPDQQMAILILAAFPSSDAAGVRWRAYLRQRDRAQDCPHLDPARLLEPGLESLPGLLDVARSEQPLPSPDALRSDGAFEVRCDAAALAGLLGEADRPDDTFLPVTVPGWWLGLRTHARPANREAACAAFYEFLVRRDADLRRSFDATCSDVASSLSSYWNENPGLPSAEEAATQLWARPELRAALCMRRLRADLVAPYATTEAEP